MFRPLCRPLSGCPKNLLIDYIVCVVILEGGRDLALHHKSLISKSLNKHVKVLHQLIIIIITIIIIIIFIYCNWFFTRWQWLFYM